MPVIDPNDREGVLREWQGELDAIFDGFDWHPVESYDGREDAPVMLRGGEFWSVAEWKGGQWISRMSFDLGEPVDFAPTCFADPGIDALARFMEE